MTSSTQSSSTSIIFQLTSSRRGWRWLKPDRIQVTAISTHILTKRMTFQGCWTLVDRLFQLTSSRRGWRQETLGMHKQFFISTHILTKRMTWPSLSTRSTYQYFNSHPHEEDDLAGNGGIHNELYFNSHPHEEDDRASGNDLCTAKAYFNSHPHEEDDIPNRLVGSLQRHFNSHPHEEDDSVL